MAVWNQELRYYISLAITAQPYGKRICLFPSLTAWTRISNTALNLSSCVPPIAQMVRRWYRNINLLSIAYAFRPRLRSRLTLSGRAFLRKPKAFGWRDSHPSFATHTGILTSKRSTSPSGLASQPLERSPTTVRRTVRSFGDTFSPGTFSAQSHSTSELLRTL